MNKKSFASLLDRLFVCASAYAFAVETDKSIQIQDFAYDALVDALDDINEFSGEPIFNAENALIQILEEVGLKKEEENIPDIGDFIIQNAPEHLRNQGKVGVSQFDGKYLGTFKGTTEAKKFIHSVMTETGINANIWFLDENGKIKDLFS